MRSEGNMNTSCIQQEAKIIWRQLIMASRLLKLQIFQARVDPIAYSVPREIPSPEQFY